MFKIEKQNNRKFNFGRCIKLLLLLISIGIWLFYFYKCISSYWVGFCGFGNYDCDSLYGYEGVKFALFLWGERLFFPLLFSFVYIIWYFISKFISHN